MCRTPAAAAARRLTPADMARLNKELSDLEPVVDSIQLLQAKRQEVRWVGRALREWGCFWQLLPAKQQDVRRGAELRGWVAVSSGCGRRRESNAGARPC